MLRAVGYVRLSRETLETTSPARQRKVIEQTCDARGFQLVRVYEDLDLSAYSGVRRPAYDEMLARASEYDVIVFWRLDRLARSTVAFGRLLERLEASDTKLVSATEAAFDTSTPIGEAMCWIIMVFAQLESRTIGIRVAAAGEHLVMSGKSRGGTRTFGYRHVRGADGHMTWVLDDTEALVVRELADRIIAGETLHSLSAALNERQVPTVRGSPWRHQTLKSLLTNPRLMGHVPFRGQILMSEGLPVVGHPPILDPGTFRRVQDILASRRTEPRRKDETLLAGIAHCALCGRKMSSMGPAAGRYICISPSPDCARPSIVMRWLDKYVTEAVLTRFTPARIAERVQRDWDAITDDQGASEAASVKAALDMLEDDRYLRGLFDGQDGTRRFEARYRQLSDRLVDLTAREQVNRGPMLADLVDASDLRLTWPELTVAHRRSIIQAVIGHLRVGPSRIDGMTVPQLDRIDLQFRA